MVNEFISRNLRVTAVDLRAPSPPPGRPIDWGWWGPEDRHYGFRHGFIVDMQCGQMMEILSAHPDFFKERQIYLLLWTDFADDALPVFQKQIGLRLDSDMTIYSGGNGTLFDMYKIDNAEHAENRIIVQPNGHWNGSHFFDFNSQVYKVTQRMDLFDIRLVGAIYVSGRFNYHSV